jgi:hypothetical protein
MVAVVFPFLHVRRSKTSPKLVSTGRLAHSVEGLYYLAKKVMLFGHWLCESTDDCSR